MLDQPKCSAHESLVTAQVEIKYKLEDAALKFAALKDKVDIIAKDIHDIMDVLTGDLRGEAKGIQQRLMALEGVVKSVNKAAWLLGIPIILAALFGLYSAAMLVWNKVVP